MPANVQTFEVKEPDFKTIRVTIEGITPMIQHKFSEKAKREMLEKQQKKAAKKKQIRNPEKEFEAAKYLNSKGKISFPALALKQALVAAARNVDGLPMTLLRGAVFFKGDEDDGLIVVKHKKCIMREDIVKLNGRTADLRYRPELKKWSMDLVIEYYADVLSADQVLSLLQIAGRTCGLGEWRPERNGDYGMFTIKQEK